jgi:hypothetical protein
VIAASIKESFAGAGEIWIRASSPTCAAAWPICRSVSRVGAPYQVVDGNTSTPIATTSSAALTSVASRRLRRSNSHATIAEATPTARSL